MKLPKIFTVLTALFLLLYQPTVFAEKNHSQNFDIMLACHGCDASTMQRKAINHATVVGQTIYIVSRSDSGDFTTREYVVTYVDPATLSVEHMLAQTRNNGVDFKQLHAPQSPLGKTLKSADERMLEVLDSVSGVFEINDEFFPSAFIAAGAQDFDIMMTEYHWNHHADKFDVLDAEWEKVKAGTQAGLDAVIFKITTAAKEAAVTYKFPDGSLTRFKYHLVVYAGSGKVHLELVDARHYDKKGHAIPLSKSTFERYLSRFGNNLHEHGERRAVIDHARHIFGGGSVDVNLGTSPGGATLRCRYQETGDPARVMIICEMEG